MTRSQQMLGLRFELRAGLGLPRPADRMEDRGENTAPRARTRTAGRRWSNSASECRAFAEHWIDVQREEFKRLGVEGDWAHPYTTMDFAAEAQIARELMKFAQNGTLYRGSKPVMWSVVEKTALAEAEVEYEDYVSRSGVGEVSGAHVDLDDVEQPSRCRGAAIVIWTTTPWTIPGNRAISYSPKIDYGLYRGDRRTRGQLGEAGRQLRAGGQARRRRVPAGARHRVQADSATVAADDLAAWPATIRSKASTRATTFTVPLLAGRPCHRRRRHRLRAHRARPRPRGLRRLDRERAKLAARGINTTIPYTVDDDGALHRSGAGLHRQARAHRQGREGRRQRGRDQGADRRRHADRARPAQAPVSAFLALEEAGDLPQHAAMVHRDGQADRERRRHAASRRHAARIARSTRSRSRAGCRSRARTASPA